jgi:hypothetical protein
VTGNEAHNAYGADPQRGDARHQELDDSGEQGGPDGGGVYNALNLTVAIHDLRQQRTPGKGAGWRASAATLNNVTLAGNTAGPLSAIRAGTCRTP